MLFTKRGRAWIRPFFQVVALITILGMLALYAM